MAACSSVTADPRPKSIDAPGGKPAGRVAPRCPASVQRDSFHTSAASVSGTDGSRIATAASARPPRTAVCRCPRGQADVVKDAGGEHLALRRPSTTRPSCQARVAQQICGCCDWRLTRSSACDRQDGVGDGSTGSCTTSDGRATSDLGIVRSSSIPRSGQWQMPLFAEILPRVDVGRRARTCDQRINAPCSRWLPMNRNCLRGSDYVVYNIRHFAVDSDCLSVINDEQKTS
jgi:hypothetical protein